MKPIEKSLLLASHNLTLSTLRMGHGNARRVLCVHGWLDNANSFLPLMPLLDDADVVAIDLPGHGHSEHLSQLSHYALDQYVSVILEAADALGWDEPFHLLGHSLGGCIAPLCAAAAPKSISGLTLIDAAGPVAESADALPDRLQRHHRDFTEHPKRTPRVYRSIDDAVETRLKANKMKRDSARLIVERQLRATDNGFQWRFDPKLRIASVRYFTEEQVHTVLQAVRCPVHCILAEDGYIVARKGYRERLNCFADLTLSTLPGNHHLHLDTPQVVASAINRSLQDTWPG